MKTVLSNNGLKQYVYPFKVYCKQSIKASLEKMLRRVGFKDLLHNGPVKSKSDTMHDVCDGKLYKEFKDNEGQLFFQDKRNIGFLLNIDWFNPFERSEYSLGAVYLVIVNLPRNVRFDWENVITLGLIPGPKEPSLHVNSFLRPVIDELLSFWEGLLINEGNYKALYKAAIIGVSNDVPATRKIGGFMAHNANKGIYLILIV